MNWRDQNGETFFGDGLSLQGLVEEGLGQTDSVYTSALSVAASLPGILRFRSDLIEDIGEFVGRTDTLRWYKVKREGRTISDFPRASNGSRYGTLQVAGLTFPVVGVGYIQNASHIGLFLGDST